ncbi:hypothetical protein RJT34_28982 [Clitoria ternatea]|uniref:Uncharacterized protein n=1 Tax=Clitoria ternatea TaxID=43366 RepID=A0AAN9FBL2_CLITE
MCVFSFCTADWVAICSIFKLQYKCILTVDFKEICGRSALNYLKHVQLEIKYWQCGSLVCFLRNSLKVLGLWNKICVGNAMNVALKISDV